MRKLRPLCSPLPDADLLAITEPLLRASKRRTPIVALEEFLKLFPRP